MGRPKSYDRDEVARRAMELFWERGFHATTTKALAAHMGVNAYSLFAEFGSKQELFETALHQYNEQVVSRLFGALEAPDAGIREIVDILRLHASAAGTSSGLKGCLMCNAATESAPAEPGTQTIVENHVDRLGKGIYQALQNAQNAGELRPEVSCEDQSRLIIAALLGFGVLMRAAVDPDVIIGAVRAACSGIERLRP